ncbi:EAL domain-containing protein [Neorhizobium sp. T25_13]|uniref:EAL domain-containing protein n=1 Tax=Neorhizobium sp. T25_13 TaxID=2093830 RepID=UPI000CF8BCC6|nr:EAL domain-containing protein [Neorhizobium sp. T25_13]
MRRRHVFRWPTARLLRLLIICAIVSLALVGGSIPLLKTLDNALMNWRFAAAPRNASGSIVYLAIDRETLDALGTWPWPRSIYADIIEKLSQGGVGDIFIDIDFSTPSTGSEDARLADALANAGASAILPVFNQHLSADAGSTTVVTQPLPALRENAWLAFANVSLDDDGTVRRFTLGDLLDGQPTQSAAAVLAKTHSASGSHLIDYSINPASVPTISLSRILHPDFEIAKLKNRSIVIGAYATELKDIFPVPVYGQLPGPILHVLAAESILQDRLLQEFDQRPVQLAFAAAVIAAALGMRAFQTTVPFLSAAAVLAIGETIAFMAQKDHALVVHTATSCTVLLLGLVLMFNEKVDFTQFLAELAGAEQRNIRRLLRKIVTDSTDAVLAFDHHLKIFEESDSAKFMLASGQSGNRGKLLAEVVSAPIYDLVVSLAAEHSKKPGVVRSSSSRFSISVDGAVKHLDATITISPVERPEEGTASRNVSFIGSLVIRDVTTRQIYEERLQYLSSFDALTGLMNRRTFAESLGTFDRPVHVAAVGLHRFSVLNAAMGRDTGDKLLQAVAERLLAHPSIASAGRLGGDVFAVAIPQSQEFFQKDCAELVLGVFDAPFQFEQRTMHIDARVGMYTAVDTCETDFWLERAEHALDDAKTIAGAGWQPYNPDVALRQHRSRELEQAMRDSFNTNEFFLLYQPQVALGTGLLNGAEALLRWKHPEFGLVSPATFIPVAEANGFICDLGRWALRHACIEASRWPDNLAVAVNVAPVQLIRADLVADVKNALAESGLPAARLHLEITESAFVEHTTAIQGALSDLRAMGVRIALDDFGTGYSSLSYLAGFPLDTLKIDQTFVKKMASDQQSSAIVQTIVSLAKGLGLSLVAEGIESRTEWQMLASLGCEDGQGYFFGKPLSPDDLLALTAELPWLRAA